MTQRTEIDCDDPEVAQEHYDADGEVWEVRDERRARLSIGWDATDFAVVANAAGSSFRLVFDSPDQAGQALHRWQEQRRRVMEQRHDGTEGLVGRVHAGAFIMGLSCTPPIGYRIAAPEPAPVGGSWTPQAGDRRQAMDDDAAAMSERLMEAESLAHAARHAADGGYNDYDTAVRLLLDHLAPLGPAVCESCGQLVGAAGDPGDTP